MISIIIDDEEPTKEALADVLNKISEQIYDGYTSGVYPAWHLEGEEAKE